MIKAILTDFDQTLFDTQDLKPSWQGGKPDWPVIYNRIPDIQLYDGWRGVRDSLNNLPWGVVSCNVKGLIDKTLKHHKFAVDFIIGRYGEGQRWPRRPLPKIELFGYAMQHAGVNELQPSEVLYIGDEAADITQANDFGFLSGACFWGTLEPNELAATNPTYRLQTPNDLLTLNFNTL